MEIQDKKVRVLTEEEYTVKIVDKVYKYIDFIGEDGKPTSWSMTDDKNDNVVANDDEVIQIIAAVQNAVDRYNNRTPRHKELNNDSDESSAQ